jgi:hypothetical protein
MLRQTVDIIDERYVEIPAQPVVTNHTARKKSNLHKCAYYAAGCLLYTGGIGSIITFAFYIYIQPHLHC